MNDFGSALSAALHEEAREIMMSADMQQAEQRLQESMRKSRSERRTWTLVLAAAAVLVIVAGAAFMLSRPTAPAVSPVEPTVQVTTESLTPNLTARLPGWTAAATYLEKDPGKVGWNQTDCSQQPGGACPTGQDLRLRFFSVLAMYKPADGPTVTSEPTYAQYVSHIEGLQDAGAATVSEQRALTVGGLPATAFSVTPLAEEPGSIACENEFIAKPDCWAGISPGRELELVVVDQGAGLPPTVITMGMNSANTEQTQRFAEFQAMLDTIRFLP